MTKKVEKIIEKAQRVAFEAGVAYQKGEPHPYFYGEYVDKILILLKRERIEELTRCIVRLLHIPNGDKETIRAIRSDFVARLEELKRNYLKGAKCTCPKDSIQSDCPVHGGLKYE